MDKSNFNIHRMTYTYHPIRIQNEGYKSFVDQVDGFSNRYSDLIPQIKALYSNFDFYIEDTQQKVKDIVEQQYAYAKTQKWYSSVWTSNELKPEFAEYLLNDYHYRNQAEAYIIYAQGLMGVCTKFQKEAVDLYKKLSKITGYPEELPESIQNYYSSKPQSFIDELVGEYQPIDSTLTNSVLISYKDDQLFLNKEKAYLIKDNYIISVLEYPTANLWQYDETTKELVFSQLMPSTSKRKKIDN